MPIGSLPRELGTDWDVAQRQWFEWMVNHSNDIITFGSAEGVFRYVSPAFERLLGYSPNESLGRCWMDFIHSEDGQDLASSDNADSSPDGHSAVARIRHKSGDYLWLEITTHRLQADDRQPVETLSIAKNVTESIQLQRMLNDTKNDLADTQRVANIGSWVWDLEKDVRFWSEEAYRILGIEDQPRTIKESAILLQRVHEEDKALYTDRVDDALTHGNLDMECRIVRETSGEERIIAIRAEVVFSEHGNPLKMVGTIRDITESTIAHRTLARTQTILESFIEDSPDPILFFDKHSVLTRVNRAFTALFGWQEQEVLGLSAFELPWVPRDHVAEEIGWFHTYVSTGRTLEGFDTVRLKRDGALVDMSMSLSPIHNSSNQFDGWAVIMRDVSERKLIEKHMRESEKLSIVGQLAAGIAHEIRNPLTSLKGFVQLMSMPGDSGRQKNYLQIMHDELARIEFIVNELLVLAKPQKEEIRTIDLSKHVERVILMLGSEALMRGIQMDWLPVDSPVYVDCVPYQVQQVAINLLKNAFDAMNGGGNVRVRVDREDDAAVIRVIDHGIGMSSEQIDKLGEPFYTTKDTGTGLGLMVSREIVNRHNGRIEFLSEPGSGTTVSVFLPVASN